MPVGGRMGGHFVSGHVDGVGEVEVFEEEVKIYILQISLPSEYAVSLVDKGCVSVDGCSLTVCDVGPDSFAIWLIPHTLDKTNRKAKNCR